jgi:hypothetical protein
VTGILEGSGRFARDPGRIIAKLGQRSTGLSRRSFLPEREEKRRG